MIKGSFYILFFFFLGEMLSMLLHNFVPGSVLGMILLFLALYFKLLNPENVRTTATTITKNMALFFIPAGVGLMVYVEVLSQSFTAIVVAIAGSTILTIATVAIIQQRFENRRAKGGKADA